MRTIIIALYPYQATGQNAWLDHGAGMTYTTAREAGYNRYPFGKKVKDVDYNHVSAVLGGYRE